MKYIQTNKGFTLVEMIVSLGIFTIVALVAVGALIKILDANKKSIALKTAINNMNFTLESMSREMRVGKNYSCNTNIPFNEANNVLPTNDCAVTSNIGWRIAFNSSENGTFQNSTSTCKLIYAYQYDPQVGSSPATLKKAQQSYCGQYLTLTDDFQDIISKEVKIDNSIVSVDNSGQPFATFFFHGVSGVKAREQAEFTVQTQVTQRLPK